LSSVKALRATVVALSILLALSHSFAGTGEQGMTVQGMTVQGMTVQGMTVQGMTVQGMTVQGMTVQGMTVQGMTVQGMTVQGMTVQGMTVQGMTVQGMTVQGMTVQGMTVQATSLQGMQLRGVDGLRSLGAPLDFQRLALGDVQVPGLNMQGLQTGAPVSYVAPSSTTGIQLQAAPANTAPGSYIFVPGMSGTAADIKGSFWNMVFKDPAGAEADVIAYVADVAKDTQQNLSTSAANDDVYLYTVYYRRPATGQWASLCPLDAFGKAQAMAIPVDSGDWTSAASRARFAFACTASGVGAKCARVWGYKPWVKTPADLQPFYDACVIAARADYCQDDQSFTRDGTTVDLFDNVEGGPSINPTVGLPFEPFSPGVMLHEEYQISVAHTVREDFCPPGGGACSPDFNAFSPETQALVSGLQRSGLESSRYPDLDPGRSCAAAPFIDRCDPQEPFVCYRATNMSTRPYGSFLAVNSPRHCSHDEDHDGEPLDPRCDACVSRVCQIDPTCCGDAGSTFYPGSLVWDGRCRALRQDVCRSTAGTGATGLWRAGQVATPAGSKPVVFLQGATGSFEGIVTEAGVQLAEGWACDPDFPSASSPVQISVGGELGAAGTTLFTASADRPLVPSWRETVAAECGGAGRHGFRFALPAGSAGRDVFVYGIDLNTPGAPFSLLRGGKKTAPGVAASPRAAIWSGWIEPPASGNYAFTASAGPADKFRLWVNGIFVDGNWTDPETTPPTPGAFTLDAPFPAPTPFLQKGVRYAIRIEYLRPDTSTTGSSRFALTWASANASPPVAAAPIPASALYPMAQGGGNGAQGTFFKGSFATDALPADGSSTLPRTFGAIDNVFSDGVPPVAGLTVNDSFGARFEGQLVPPISGDYTFSADTDGAFRIVVDGQVVAGAGPRAAAADPTCAHDVCATGGAVSRTCPQNNFCAGRICLVDPSCCSITWDARCVQEVQDLCGTAACVPTPPVTITLQAGRKYDVEVDYQHQGGTTAAPVRGAKLRLMWALPKTPRAAVPGDRLFAATGAAAPALGVGLNAAYFSEAQLQVPILGHVEAAAPAFVASSVPSAARATSLVCGSASAPACPAGDGTLGAPALASARMVTVNADGTVAVEIKGGGATRGATVTLVESGTALGTVTVGAGATDGGLFSATLNLTRKRHLLQATQLVAGVTSAPSAVLAVDVTDPAAPAAPSVTGPSGGSVSGNGRVQASGKGTPGGTVTVVVTPHGLAPGDPGATVFATATFVVDAAGNWSGLINLGPGNYDLTVTQSSGGHTSGAAAPVNVHVALPGLTVTAPADGLSLTCALSAARTCPVTVSGTGATTTLGDVIVGDGDGAFFADRAPTLPAAGGNFSGSFALDYGRHQLKVFQRTNGQDGDGVVRSVAVRPPAGAITIALPVANAVVDSVLVVQGTGLPRQGLPGTAVVYQVPAGTSGCPATAGAGAVKLGQVAMTDAGAFSLQVSLAGAGVQCLAVSQTASSLSGGGSVESDLGAPITVRVRPAPPIITVPLTGTTQAGSTTLAVQGLAPPSSTVTIFANDVAQATTVASSTGTAAGAPFSLTLTLAAGTYRLTASATVGGAESGRSAPAVVVALGDVTPPTVTVTQNGAPVREIFVVAADETGADFNFIGQVSATDRTSAGGTPAALPATAITCRPAAGPPVPHFPLGSTQVTCQAVDAAGNRGSTTFLVTVQSREAPVISGTNLTAEAQGPGGAAVGYQLTANGFLADCAPAGSGTTQACSAWTLSDKGLGFAPIGLGLDPRTGTLYAGVSGLVPHLLSSADGGGTWQELAKPPTATIPQIVVGAGSPPALYIPSTDFVAGQRDRRGIVISQDGGQSWISILNGVAIGGIAQDPRAAAHMLAWTRTFDGTPPALYETSDGWVTFNRADAGLPPTAVLALAIDPLTPGRMYLSLAVEETQLVPLNTNPLVRMFRRTNGNAWQELNVPPDFAVLSAPANSIFVAGALEPCAPGATGCQQFPTVFAGPVYSRDGGETWSNVVVPGFAGPRFGGFDNMAFDRTTPGTVYAASTFASFSDFYRSTDSGNTWTDVLPHSSFPGLVARAMVQDVRSTALYAADSGKGIIRSTTGGASWETITPSTLPLTATTIKTVVADPVDPTVAYVGAGPAGVFRTADGGGSWQLRSIGLGDVDRTFEADIVLIDRFNRNLLYAGSALNPVWAKSPTSGDVWTTLTTATQSFIAGTVAVDPLTPGGWAAYQPAGGVGGPLVWPTGSLSAPPEIFAGSSHRLLMVPDAARTLVGASEGNFDSGGAVHLFSFRQVLQGVSPPSITDAGLGLAAVFYDGSDGSNRLFVSGKALGKDPNLLYRASVDDVRNGVARDTAWQPLSGDGVFPAFQLAHTGFPAQQDSFTWLLVDPVGGGQTMYTLGTGDTLWESHDSGRSWRRDMTAPGFMTGAWLSPVDGALYATISPAFADTSAMFTGRQNAPGVLWKRARSAGTPAGARIEKGDLRVSCTGPANLAGSAVGPGSTFPVGNTVLSCQATDAFGNTGTAAITITVRDTTGPVITVVPPAPATAPAGGTAVVTFTATAADAVDGVRPVTCTPASGTAFPIGATTVSCTATDTRGNTGRAAFPVVVSVQGSPSAAPTLNVPPDQTVEATGPAGAAPALAVTATRANGTALAPVCTPALGSTFAIGTTDVSCSATDAGITVTRGFRVTVRDTTPPAVTVPADISVIAQGAFGARVSFTSTARDLVDGTLAPSCVPASGSMFALGPTVVTCRAADRAGNQGFARFKVTVTDVNPPVLVLVDITAEATDFTGARVTYTPPPSATDVEDGTVPVDCIPASGTWFPLGATPVTCTARDRNGNESRGTFTVTVADRSPPVVTTSPNITVEAAGPAGTAVSFTVAAADLVTRGALVPLCVRTTGFGIAAPVASGAVFAVGDSLVTCTVKDEAGNAGSASFRVIVRDTTPPALTLPAPISVVADATATAVVTYTATAADTVSGSITPACTPPSGARFLIGTTTVTCVARDAAGNERRGSFTVTVRNTAPVVTVPANIVVEATSPSGAVVTFTSTATDAQDGALATTCTPASGSTFALGVTTVTCRATDRNGTTTSASFTVTVRDTTGPVLVVPPDVTVTNCATPSIGTATATDAAGGTVTVTSNKPAAFPLGTTVITYTARDARGNVTTGTQRVTAALGDDQSCCPAGSHVVIGTPSNDTLTGTTGVDCILGLGGQDTINGLAGDDVISGGDGNDIIDGGDGNDRIFGGTGQDNITGGLGNDIIDGGDGDDIIHAGSGDDVVHGGIGQDQLFGEIGIDQLFGDDGDDTLDGGPDNDTLNGGPGNDTCTGGTGTNTITQCSP
jgi:hypothetical protein